MPVRNPFEETRQAAQDWSPREQYISRSNQDRAQDRRSMFNVGITQPATDENFSLSPSDNSGIMTVADNRTSRNPNTWHQSPYFGIGGYDLVEDHDPTLENLSFFQDIKDKDTMERDAGWHLYANPSWIENNPSYGLDYMTDLWGGKGKVGFRKGLDDDEWNAYANWGIEL